MMSFADPMYPVPTMQQVPVLPSERTTGQATLDTASQAAKEPWDSDEEAAEYAADPKAYLMARCADFVKTIKLDCQRIIVATYFTPQFVTIKGADGKPMPFFLSTKTTDESMWQGRVGLLIAKGPMAWVSDQRVSFGSTTHEVGSWVLFDRQDGRQTAINRVHCRVLRDVDVWGETSDPRAVY